MALNDVTKKGYTKTDYTTVGFHGTRWDRKRNFGHFRQERQKPLSTLIVVNQRFPIDNLMLFWHAVNRDKQWRSHSRSFELPNGSNTIENSCIRSVLHFYWIDFVQHNGGRDVI